MSETATSRVIILPTGAAAPARQSAELPAALLEGIEAHRAVSSAKNTTRAYDSDWAAFQRWCDDYDQVALPASGETVSAYLTDRASLVKPSGDFTYAPSTLARWVTSINVKHHEAGMTQPGSLSEVKRTLAGIRRGHVRPTRRMAPLLLDDLKKVLTSIDIHTFPHGLIGLRDSALLVMGFAGAFRRSELASRLVEDVTIHAQDGLHVRLLTSKTDQEGRGAVKGLPFGANPLTCPPCAFLRWVRALDARLHATRPDVMRLLRETSTNVHICQGPTPELERLDPKSPLFRPVRRGGHIGQSQISGDVINDVIKRRLSEAGMNPKRFGGHSLRAGFVTQALRAGASVSEVQRQTNHRNPATVEIYRRENNPLMQNAVTRIGL